MIVTDAVEAYLLASRPSPDPLLAEMEAHGARDGIPIVVPVTGALLQVLTAAAAARRAVEIGTAIGVSTLHVARALPDDGVIVSFEVDRERHEAARAYLQRAGLGDRVDLRLQDAAVGMAELDAGSFDIAFLDGLKDDYRRHLELVLPLLRIGGTLVVDNTLLSGTVAEGRPAYHWTAEAVTAMREFNEQLLHRGDMYSVLLPVGDGVIVAVRR